MREIQLLIDVQTDLAVLMNKLSDSKTYSDSTEAALDAAISQLMEAQSNLNKGIQALIATAQITSASGSNRGE